VTEDFSSLFLSQQNSIPDGDYAPSPKMYIWICIKYFA